MLIVILSWKHYMLQIAWQLDHFHNVNNVFIHDQYICWRLLNYSFLLCSVSENTFIHHQCISWRLLNYFFFLLGSVSEKTFIHHQCIRWILLNYSFLLGSVSEKTFIHHQCISWRFLNKSFLLLSLQCFGKWLYIHVHQSIISYVADRIKYKKK